MELWDVMEISTVVLSVSISHVSVNMIWTRQVVSLSELLHDSCSHRADLYLMNQDSRMSVNFSFSWAKN